MFLFFIIRSICLNHYSFILFLIHLISFWSNVIILNKLFLNFNYYLKRYIKKRYIKIKNCDFTLKLLKSISKILMIIFRYILMFKNWDKKHVILSQFEWWKTDNQEIIVKFYLNDFCFSKVLMLVDIIIFFAIIYPFFLYFLILNFETINKTTNKDYYQMTTKIKI